MSSFIYPDSKTRKIYGQVGKRIAHRIRQLVKAGETGDLVIENNLRGDGQRQKNQR